MWGALELMSSRIGSNARALVVPDSVDLGRLFEPFEGQASNPGLVGLLRGGSRVPLTFYICETRGLAIGPARELLISNPLESRYLWRPLSLSGLRDHWSVITPFEGRLFRASGAGRSRVTLTW
jgi:hypothetical protein